MQHFTVYFKDIHAIYNCKYNVGQIRALHSCKDILEFPVELTMHFEKYSQKIYSYITIRLTTEPGMSFLQHLQKFGVYKK